MAKPAKIHQPYHHQHHQQQQQQQFLQHQAHPRAAGYASPTLVGLSPHHHQPLADTTNIFFAQQQQQLAAGSPSMASSHDRFATPSPPAVCPQLTVTPPTPGTPSLSPSFPHFAHSTPIATPHHYHHSSLAGSPCLSEGTHSFGSVGSSLSSSTASSSGSFYSASVTSTPSLASAPTPQPAFSAPSSLSTTAAGAGGFHATPMNAPRPNLAHLDSSSTHFQPRSDRAAHHGAKEPRTPEKSPYHSSAAFKTIITPRISRPNPSPTFTARPSPQVTSGHGSLVGHTFVSKNFVVERELGSGSSSRVYSVYYPVDGKHYALKVPETRFKSQSERRDLIVREEQLSHIPPHPNIVQHHYVWENDGFLYTAMDHCIGGSLDQYRSALPTDTLWSILTDVLLALRHLHHHGFVHMDVKPENLFIDEAKRIKLGDFGMALRINYPTDTEGDARYVAPELLYSAFRTVGASPVFDIYSLGASMFELATGLEMPSKGELFNSIRSDNEVIRREVSKYCPPELANIIADMLAPNPSHRPSIHTLLCVPQIYAIKQLRVETDPEYATIDVYPEAPSSTTPLDSSAEDDDDDEAFLGGRSNATDMTLESPPPPEKVTSTSCTLGTTSHSKRRLFVAEDR